MMVAAAEAGATIAAMAIKAENADSARVLGAKVEDLDMGALLEWIGSSSASEPPGSTPDAPIARNICRLMYDVNVGKCLNSSYGGAQHRKQAKLLGSAAFPGARAPWKPPVRARLGRDSGVPEAGEGVSTWGARRDGPARCRGRARAG